MKPLSHLTAKRGSHRGEEAPVGSRSKHPAIDYHYHAAAGNLRAADNRLRLKPSFRDLSREFLATEMKRHYVAEAILFAIIVGISAWPMVPMMQAMAQLAK